MPEQQKELEKFFEALEQVREERHQELFDYPKKEQDRLRWIEFQRAIERAWLPIMQEYLEVLGKLWFGYEMRLKGTEFLKKPVPVPTYKVVHKLFGPLAIFEVVENAWRQRDAPFEMEGGKSEPRTQAFQRGFRCRVELHDNGQYEFQDDHNQTLFQSDNGTQVDQEKLRNFFAEVYLRGPEVIFSRWDPPLLPGGKPFNFAGNEQ